MSRQLAISLWGGAAFTYLPVTDASMSTTREPVIEQSMSGKGGEILYGGLYSAIQGSFSGAYRPLVFATYITEIMKGGTDVPASFEVRVYDDNDQAFKAPTCYISSFEISMRVGELAKITFNFVGQGMENLTAAAAGTADFTEEVPIFYKSSTSWGTASEFTMRVERPYAADDYILGGDFYSQSIYQSGDTKVTGTVKLGQKAAYKATDAGKITLSLIKTTDATTTFEIPGTVLAGAELGISGRGLINKTQNWAAPSKSGDGTTGIKITAA